MTDVLSQDEIDALLNGVDGGEVDTNDESTTTSSDSVETFDFASNDRVGRGRFPTLDVINDRFARTLRSNFYSVLRQVAEITPSGMEARKFGDYMRSLFVPTSINLVKMKPLRGLAMIIFDAKLVYSMVDAFFGSEGKFHTKIEGRDFTDTEANIVHKVLQRVFTDYQETWSSVFEIEMEYDSTELNPAMANVMGPNEVVIVSQFDIQVHGANGTLHIVLPYAMLEPIKDLLRTNHQNESAEADETWKFNVKAGVLDSKVKISSDLISINSNLRDVMNFEVGTVIPIKMPDHVPLTVQGIPMSEAKIGELGDNIALKLLKELKIS